MTPRQPGDPSAPSDARVRAAWRAVSREEPAPAIDAAIRAAARREAGARPRRSESDGRFAARRQWWPLAAAATLAAIAAGVLQLATPDRLGAPAADQAVVTDLPASAGKAEAPTAPPVPRPAAGAERGGDARADAPRHPAPKPASRAPDGNGAAALAEPFPAARQAPPPAADNAIGERAMPPREAIAPAKTLATPRSAAAGAATVSPQALGGSATEAVRAKDQAPLPVADWIARIRRLRDAGRFADAARELAAFRAAHADHDRLLPPDLRDWRPPQ